MAMTERRADAPDLSAAPTGTPRGFRPASRRRARVAAGAALAAVGIGGNVLLYTSLDDTTQVVQVTDNIRAGEQITADDLRIVEVELDASVPVVTADRIATIIGQYATVYIAGGTLIVDVLVQPEPLISPGAGVVAVEIRPTQVPYGVLERSRVQLVVVDENTSQPVLVTEGRVVSIIDETVEGTERGSMSVEVAESTAAAVAAADDVRVVLLDPGVDPLLPGPSEGATAPAADDAAATANTVASPTTAARPTTTLAATTTTAATSTAAATVSSTTPPTTPQAPATTTGATSP